MSRGLTRRIKVGSISTRPAARAVARRVTALLWLVPAAEGVSLAGREVWLHSVPVLSNSEHSFQETENKLDFSTSVPRSPNIQSPQSEQKAFLVQG